MGNDVEPVGAFIQEELDARGWSVADLAKAMMWPRRRVEHVMSGDMPVQWRVATDLGRAFGTSMALWLNLETRYRVSQERQRERAENV